MRKEVRRVAGERLDDAIERLELLERAETADAAAIEEAVHSVRKRCKEVRGLARLVAPALGRSEFRRVDHLVRDAASELSALRDAHAVLATFDSLSAAQSGRIDAALESVRARQYEQAQAATESLRPDDARMTTARRLLVEARDRSATWKLPSGFEPLGDGLRVTYRRGRKGLRKARRTPTDARLHEWRKAVKYLWYQMRLLERAAPSTIGPLVERLDDLADALGDDHDLAVLVEQLDAEPARFGTAAVVEHARQLARAQQDELRRRAFRLGATVFAEADRAFVARIEAYWDLALRDGPELPTGGIVRLARQGRPDPVASASTVERERKYLVEDIPGAIDLSAGVQLRQGYLAIDDGVAVRVRDAGPDGHTLTIKAGRGTVRTELEWSIDGQLFDEAWPLTEGRRIVKSRHRSPLGEHMGEHMVELDVFEGELAGLVVAEVEFDTDADMEAFEPPSWFGPDVSDDPGYTNAGLAIHGLPSAD
jgi:CYTH domain-containing protein/CHAD domain-containing protein